MGEVATSLAKKRAKYYQAIFEYKIRRSAMRKRYNFSFGDNSKGKENKEYKKAVKKINAKIAAWSKQIRLIDKKTSKVKILSKAVKEFTGYDLHRKDSSFKRDTKFAKMLYYKYGIENGIRPIYLREYIGMSRPSQPMEYRSEFTNLIIRSDYDRQRWENFKKYLMSNVQA